MELFDAAGFFPVDLGDLVTGGAMQQFGGPLVGHNLVRFPSADAVRWFAAAYQATPR